MAQISLHLDIFRHCSFGPVLIHCKDAEGIAVPLGGYTAYAEVRKDARSSRLLNLAPVIAADDEDGLITIPEIPWEDTDDMCPVFANWDLILEDADGKRTPPLIGGRFNINIPITQP